MRVASFALRLRCRLGVLLVLACALTSTAAAQTDTRSPSFTTVTGLTTLIYYGQLVDATGNVSGGSPTGATVAGGQLSFLIDNNVVCALTLNGFSQSCPALAGAGVPAGQHTFSASYSGNDSFLPSSSGPQSFTVLPDDTTGTLASSLNPSPAGQNVTFTATFSALYAVPTGIVTFLDGGTAIGTGTLAATSSGLSSTASFSTSSLAFGTHSITAVYAATQNFNASSSAALSQQITAPANASFQITLTPAAVSVVAGNTTSLGVTVTPLNGFVGNVQLACANLPAEAACVFADDTVAAGGSTTLMLTTTAVHPCDANTFASLSPPGLMPLRVAPVLALLLLPLGFVRRRRRLPSLFLAFAALCLLPVLSGCGAGYCHDFGTPPGVYTVAIAGTSTGTPVLSAQAPLQLTVTH